MATDSTRSHAHGMDQHQHTVSGSSGAHTYQAPAAGGSGSALYLYGGGAFGPIVGTSPTTNYTDSDGIGYTVYGGLLGQLGSGGSTTATTSGGSISGFTNAAGAISTHQVGDIETAPQHQRVRYFIRAQ